MEHMSEVMPPPQSSCPTIPYCSYTIAVMSIMTVKILQSVGVYSVSISLSIS